MPSSSMIGALLRCTLVAALLILSTGGSAQSEEDALRMSTVLPGGTARSAGMGNAFGALGADGSAAAINPAGMGLYRTSELSLTPSLEINDATSTYNGNKASDTKTRFFFNNLTLALNSPADNGSDWLSSTFGVVFDRQATHHWRRHATADNVGTSILDDFAYQATGLTPSELYESIPFTAGVAYDAFGIDPLDSASTTYFAALPAGALVDQSHTIDSRGASTNTSLFYSANYMNKLYIGMTVGIIGNRYISTTTHTERNSDEDIDLKDMTYRQYLTTTGNGIDVKAGVIYRFNDRFRAGLAFHSPRWTQLNDAYNTDMRTAFRSPDADGRTNYSAPSGDGAFTYRINTAWRTVLSAAYIIGANGLISVDHEYVDQRNTRLRPSARLVDSYDFRAENSVIKSNFRAVHNIRVGTEWRSGNWYFRMGWGYMPNAYAKSDPRHADDTRSYAGGLGYRATHWAVDLGLNYIQGGNKFFQYDPFYAAITNESRSTMRSLVTVSIRP